MSYLGTGVGAGEQDTGNLAGKGGGLAGRAPVAKGLDSADGELLLVESGLREGHEGR